MPDAEAVASAQAQADLALLLEAGREGGAIALSHFGDDPKVWMKEGDSPVSEADFAVDRFLRETLTAARPDYGWLSEETEDDPARLERQRTFVVDPIDGTRGFIAGHRRWCVALAVVEGTRPIAGVLVCPALGEEWTALSGQGAARNGSPVRARAVPEDGSSMVVTGPRSFQTSLIRDGERPVERAPFVPSLAYRIALVAAGEVHLALARASAKDWDLAAADLILAEAGGRLSDLSGGACAYNCRDTRHGTLVASAAASHPAMLDLAGRAVHGARGGKAAE